jgi:hypothetical protein
VNDETGGETNTLQEVYMKAEEKYDKEWKIITEKREKDNMKRTVERVIIVVSSLGALYEKVFMERRRC